MSKIVDSVLHLFGRRAGGKDREPIARSKSKRGRATTRHSLLAADSFVFLPGEVEASRDQRAFWGEVLASRDYSTISSQIGEDRGVVHCEVQRRRCKATSPADELALKKAVITRRLSGTLLRGGCAEVEDGSQHLQRAAQRQEVVSEPHWQWDKNDTRFSGDPTARYIYDRLVTVPRRSTKVSPAPGPQQQQQQQSQRASFRRGGDNNRESNLLRDSRYGGGGERSPRNDRGSGGGLGGGRQLGTATPSPPSPLVVTRSAEYTIPMDSIDWDHVRRLAAEGEEEVEGWMDGWRKRLRVLGLGRKDPCMYMHV